MGAHRETQQDRSSGYSHQRNRNHICEIALASGVDIAVRRRDAYFNNLVVWWWCWGQRAQLPLI